MMIQMFRQLRRNAQLDTTARQTALYLSLVLQVPIKVLWEK
jgi:hypothetical protein